MSLKKIIRISTVFLCITTMQQSYSMHKDIVEDIVIDDLDDNQLGIEYMDEENYAEALKHYTKAFNEKKADAATLFNLGFMYHEGLGVKEDIKEAVKFYTLAAEQGDFDAAFNLGLIYARGQEGIEPNLDTAVKWLSIVAEKDNREEESQKYAAIYELGVLFLEKKDYQQAKHYLEIAAKDGGVIRAMDPLAHIYMNGLGLEQPDFDMAISWCKKALALSKDEPNSTTIVLLGRAYIQRYEENQSSKDVLLVLQELNIAAQAGFIDAMGLLGKIYSDGMGIPKNIHMAMKWFFEATQSDDTSIHKKNDAKYNLDLMFLKQGQDLLELYDQKTNPTAKDLDNALQWLKKASKSETTNIRNAALEMLAEVKQRL